MLSIRKKAYELPTMESFIDDFFGRTSSIFSDMLTENFTNYGGLNIVENEDNYELSMVLPGYKKEDININIDNDVLTISSEIKNEKEEKTKNYISRNFTKSSFCKKLILSDDIDKDKINAKMEDGILNLKLDKIKKVELNTSKKINID